jgi:DNA-binding LytR/AlgR family response regulator
MLQTTLQGISIERADYKASSIGWGSYMTYLTAYCVLFNGVVESAPIDILESVGWVVREWGIWLVLTPLVCAALREIHSHASIINVRKTGQLYALAGVATLAVALIYRVGIDVYGGADLAVSLVYFFPKHSTALVLVVLAWHLVRKVEQKDSNTRPTQNPETVSETLLVSKGQREHLIRVDQIDVISAGGNYVDIRCGDDVYLLRSSLKQLEKLLLTHNFIRVHRSHLVNVCSLLHMTKTVAGNGSAVLRGGYVVPMSKKYRAALKKTSCSVYSSDA